MWPPSLYTDDIWNRFCEKFGTNDEEFELKTYPQFDPFFNFLSENHRIHALVSDQTLQGVAQHSFIPFVKILTKTPRFRYQENEREYMLETKIRPIAFASHFDTYIYSFYAFALTEKYQTYIRKQGFNDCILAYRTDLDGKCNIQFAKEVFDKIKLNISEKKQTTVIALDITGYFDNINHAILKEKWLKVIGESQLPIDQYKIFRSLTNYSYVSKDSILRHFNVDLKQMKEAGVRWQTLCDLISNDLAGPTFHNKMSLIREHKLVVTNPSPHDKSGKGIPQGSAMSAVLSNIYLIDFDLWLWNLSQKHNFTYRRYCDDLIAICDSDFSGDLNTMIVNEITKYGLKIQNKKTEVIEFLPNSKNKIRAFNKKKILQDKVILNARNEQKYYKNLQYLGFEFNGINTFIRPGSLSRYFMKMKRRIIKTIVMAYSKKSKVNKIKRRQIYFRYSHFGPRNFITYAQKAAKKMYANSDGKFQEGMNSRSISKQIAGHVQLIETEIRKKSIDRYQYKEFVRTVKKTGGKRKKIPLKL